ncbi:DUF4124 domain-containing protein [Rhodocyclus tenuis]|uniref:DUF4124 domain-containing protein n=1 Tax=Rhodocyclus gracilis TaxID=2929842 RepID=A0ABX0WM79_9RHOO|nr:DUF4124 domain-containing protein [Rhodocyclus gracilis]NJA89553.1 DUF4124 domain-containing protein [Rhodocyclus gracilis]
MTMTLRALLPLLALATLPAHADIYRCIDDDQYVTYSNVQSRHCKKLNLESQAAPAAAAAPARVAPRTPTPANFPRVDADAQRARDADRRHILDSELLAEQKNLQQAQKDLADLPLRGVGEAGAGRANERAQAVRERVALHERNIEALRKELAKLR